MDNIWAPWRMDFIQDQRQKKGGSPCVFCELGRQSPDSQNLVLHKGKQNYVVMNRFPYANGHLLIVPFDHKAQLKELTKEAHQEILGLTILCIDIMKETLNAEGFNCGMNVGKVGGCGILDHYHWHIVPRWTGDTNFMPVLNNTRILPDYLSQTYQRLKPGFEKLASSAGQGG